jgi:hypothetical protein
MANEIEIGVTKIENIIEITSQPTDQVIDIGVTDNADNVVLNITPSVIEININRGTTNAGLVTSVNSRIGDVVVDANDVGLGNVDNTGDFQKPISNDTQVALNSKADLIDGIVPDNQLPVTTLSIMSGLSQGGVMTINTDTAKFDVTAGFGYIVNGHTNPDLPIKTRVPFAGSTANVIPNIGTTKQTFVSIDINGALNLTPNPLTPTERRNFIRLGVLIHLDNTNIIFIDNQPTVNIEVGGQLQDLLEAFGFRSLSGNRIFPVAANLKIKKELGKLFKSGANFKNLTTQPHSFTSAAQDPITFKYRTQTGAEGSNITDINPTIYDNNGTITAMPATATLASIQRIFIFQDDTIRIQPGQKFFNNLNEAVTAINSDVFTTDVDISENALYLGAIVLIRGTTALNNLAQAIFVPASGVSANGSTSAAPLGYTAEDSGNKQNSLAVDGTAAKYPTVDAVNAGLALKAPSSGSANYIQNGTSQQNANLNISGSGTFENGINIISNSNVFLKISRVAGFASQFFRNASDGTLTWQSILSDNITTHDFITCGEADLSHASTEIKMQPQGGIVSFGGSVNATGAATFASSVTATAHVTTGGLATQLVKGNGGLTVGYKVYTALLNFSDFSPNSPVITSLLDNTLGGTVVWSKESTGKIIGVLNGVFTANKVIVFVNESPTQALLLNGIRVDSNTIRVTGKNTSGTLSDAYGDFSIEIRVYN